MDTCANKNLVTMRHKNKGASGRPTNIAGTSMELISTITQAKNIQGNGQGHKETL